MGFFRCDISVVIPGAPGGSRGYRTDVTWHNLHRRLAIGPDLARWWRDFAHTSASANPDATLHLSSSATVNAQFWLSYLPWRPTAGWAAVAAMLAAGLMARPGGWDWREIALLLLLVDPLWGSIWRLAAGRLEVLPLRGQGIQQRFWLPYLQPDSPAAQLLGWDAHNALPLLFRVALPAVLVAIAVALVLGPTAVWLTIVVTVVSALGWTGRHTFSYVPAALHTAVTISLPWLLTLTQLDVTPAHGAWAAHLTLVLLWSLHNWGEGRCLRVAGDRLGLGLMAAADLGMGLLFIVARMPFWLALVAVLWLPTWLTVYQRRAMGHLQFWWLLAMLISGLALGQVPSS